MMKNRSIFWVVLMLFAGALESYGQVAVSLAVNRTNYLKYETIYARVSLKNYSGQALSFNEDENLSGGIKFNIEMPGGGKAQLRKNAFNPLLGLVIPPGASEELMIPISNLYVIVKPGNYRVTAVLSHKLLLDKYQSGYVNFSVCNGMSVWERVVGVPRLSGKDDNEKIPSRTVRIMTFNDGKEKVYSLMIEDEKFVYGVARIGYDIGNFPPLCEIDGLSRTHVLIQVSPSVFSYFMYDIDCNLEEKEVYVKSGVVPSLVADPKDGSVIVAGGKKAVKDVDYVEEDGQPVLLSKE